MQQCKISDLNVGNVIAFGELINQQKMLWLKADKNCTFISLYPINGGNNLVYDAIEENGMRYNTNYTESNIFRWLNSNSPGGLTTPSHDGDILSYYYTTTDGFLSRFEDYEISAILDTVLDDAEGKFHLPSVQEIFEKGKQLQYFKRGAKRAYLDRYKTCFCDYWTRSSQDGYIRCVNRSAGTESKRPSWSAAVRPMCVLNKNTELELIGNVWHIKDNNLNVLTENNIMELLEIF